MATIIKNWANGDPLTLITSAGGVSVSSAPNLTGGDREMEITLRTTNAGDKSSKMVRLVQKKEPIRSYLVDTNNVVRYFELENTPISNFCSDSMMPNSNIVVNGVNVRKTDIKKLFFGDSYMGVTNIGGYFLYHFHNLISVDFFGLANVTEIGNGFLVSCYALPSVDLSPLKNLTAIPNSSIANLDVVESINLSGLVNVTSIGNNDFYGCPFLISLDFRSMINLQTISYASIRDLDTLHYVYFSAVVPPTAPENILSGCPYLTSIYVPSQSVNLYKVATNWKVHANKIKPL